MVCVCVTEFELRHNVFRFLIQFSSLYFFLYLKKLDWLQYKSCSIRDLSRLAKTLVSTYQDLVLLPLFCSFASETI